MSTPDDAASAIAPSQTAGALLRSTREAAGLTLGAIAQQLKLAPRQVEALEADDYARLPGRTFVRGFLRNYARCLGLDPNAVLELLPATDQPAALDRPALQPTPRAIGELPSEGAPQRIWSRVAIPLALLAIVGVAAVYEFTRQQAESRRAAAEAAAKSAAPANSTSVPLPNPLVDVEKTAPSTAPSEANPPVSPVSVGSSAESPAPSAPAAPTPPAPASTASPAPASTASFTPASTASPVKAAPSVAEATSPPVAPSDAGGSVVFMFRGASWIEVKDRTGSIVLSLNGTRGTTHTANGSPPFEIVIGNAPEVGVMFRGEPVDLSRYTRQNVARLTLK